jgi:hypothetical protein
VSIITAIGWPFRMWRNVPPRARIRIGVFSE